ncbi:MAG: NAD(P)-dependent alcohol dehydrogenase [Desulfobacterales bacterium]|nr:NAD(P)-dependent alcohol dehydrogenase [Desulfobacterales bacterium]
MTRFKKGDQVFSFVGFGFGAYAEYKCLPENAARAEEGLVALKPVNMTHEEAACRHRRGIDRIEVHEKRTHLSRAESPYLWSLRCLGTFAVQLARHFGAEVTGVCSRANLELVKSLGADKVIDYTRTDFTESGENAMISFSMPWPKLRVAGSKKSLKKNGIFLSAHDDHGSAAIKTEDLVFLKELIEAGKIRSVIDRTYLLEEIVAAHRYVDLGHKKGSVVITLHGEQVLK